MASMLSMRRPVAVEHRPVVPALRDRAHPTKSGLVLINELSCDTIGTEPRPEVCGFAMSVLNLT